MRIRIALMAALACLSTAAHPAALDPTGEREHSAGSVIGAYFIVHEATQQCVDHKVRDQQWREHALAPWLEKHKSYLFATRGFMAHRLEEMRIQEGPEARAEYVANMKSAVPQVVRGAMAKLFAGDDYQGACANFEADLAKGEWDLTTVSRKLAERNKPVDFEDLRAAGAPFADKDTENTYPLPFTVSL